MLLCVDVQYEDHRAVAACVGFSDWSDADSTLELVVRSESAPKPYEPGHFYKRELPHILSVVERVLARHEVDAIVIDGHVWLDAAKPGLGAHLYHALGDSVPIVGVAKSEFREGKAVPVRRGQSRQPLFVTAIGIDAARAADFVRAMHGQHRIPTLLKRVDQLARGNECPHPATR